MFSCFHIVSVLNLGGMCGFLFLAFNICLSSVIFYFLLSQHESISSCQKFKLSEIGFAGTPLQGLGES